MKSHSFPALPYRGFTLLEVLVALAILSLGMLAVIEAVTEAASNSGYLRDKTIAHWVAMNRLTEMRLQPYANLHTGETSGSADMANQHWRWTAAISQTPVTSMQRIDVSVSRDSDEKNQLASVTGFVGSKIAPPGTVTASWDNPGLVTETTTSQPSISQSPGSTPVTPPTSPVVPLK